MIKDLFFQYYISLIKRKQILIFSFYTNNDYNSKVIKVNSFLFNFALFYIVNSLFFNDSTMHKIYEDEGIFNFIYSIPNIIYSLIISSIINILISKLSLSDENIIELKKESDINKLQMIKPKIIKKIKIKFFLFYSFNCIFLILF